MRRISEDELAFYDRLAARINGLLGHPACPLNQSSLAARIGWNRSSLCNFVNRVDKSIAAHFIPRIASVLRIPTGTLVNDENPPAQERTFWDPRSEEAEVIIERLASLRKLNLPRTCLTGVIPLETLPSSAMVANFANSIADAAGPLAAERSHELIEAIRASFKAEGNTDLEYYIPFRNLLRIPDREPPYQDFTSDEVAALLENLKKEWVRHRGLRLIAVQDGALTPDAGLELAANHSVTVVGKEMQIHWSRDLRIHLNDDLRAVAATRECLTRLKRSARLGVRERPSVHDVELVIDRLLLRVRASEDARGPRRPCAWTGKDDGAVEHGLGIAPIAKGEPHDALRVHVDERIDRRDRIDPERAGLAGIREAPEGKHFERSTTAA